MNNQFDSFFDIVKEVDDEVNHHYYKLYEEFDELPKSFTRLHTMAEELTDIADKLKALMRAKTVVCEFINTPKKVVKLKLSQSDVETIESLIESGMLLVSKIRARIKYEDDVVKDFLKLFQ